MENLKSWKTSSVGWSQLVLGLVSFVLFTIGKIDYIALGGSIGFIVWIGGIVGNMFAKDSDVTHSGGVKASKRPDPIGGDGPSEGERD